MTHIPARWLHLVLVVSFAVAAWTVTTEQPARAGESGCRGVEVTPRSNIQRAIDRKPRGTTFCFAKGVYRLARPVFPKTGDRLIGGSGVVISGAKVLSSFTRQGGWWVASGQRQQSRPSNEQCQPSSYTGCRYAEGVFIDGRPLLQVTSLDALRKGRFYFDYGADKIYLANDPRGRRVEASRTPAAFAGYAGKHDRVLVSGFRIEKFANEGTGLVAAVKPGNAWVIQGNEITLNHRLAVFANDRTIIRGNNLHRNGMAAVKGQGDEVKLIRNRIVRNNTDRFSFAYSAGARFTSTKRLLLRNNLVLGNRGPGLKTDTNNIYTRYEGNRVIGNSAPGIAHEKSYQATIIGNYLKNNGRSGRGGSLGNGANILLNASRDVEIARNRSVSTIDVHGVALIDANRGTGRYGEHEIRNVIVHHNVIRLAKGAEVGIAGPDRAVYDAKGNRFRANTYYLERRAAGYFRWKGSLLTHKQWRQQGNDRDGSFLSW